jgi:hypothetical protein
MAQITLSIVADDESDLSETLVRLALSMMSESGDDLPAAAAEPTDTARIHGFDQKRMNKYLGMLTDDAAIAVRFIAERTADGRRTSVGDVLEHLNLTDGKALGGRMSSLGHALRSMPRGVSLPVVREGDWYEMDGRIATLVLASDVWED